jgi:hypothetical protein
MNETKKLNFDVLVNGEAQSSKPATMEFGIVETEVVKIVLEELQARLSLADSNVEIVFSEQDDD